MTNGTLCGIITVRRAGEVGDKVPRGDMNKYERVGALVWKELSGFDSDFADQWAVKEYGAKKKKDMEWWLAGHPQDINVYERVASMFRANYEYFKSQFATTKDPRLADKLNATAMKLGEAESDLANWWAQSGRDGEMKISVGMRSR